MPEQAERSESDQEAPAASSAPPIPTTRDARGGRDVKTFVRENARLVGSIAMFAAGIVIVMLGWYGTARTNILSQQIPYMVSGGLLGLGLIIVAGFMGAAHLIEQRTDQMRRDLLRALDALPAAGPAATNGARSTGGRAAATPGEVFVLDAGHSYHLAGCPIIEGKQTSATTARAAIGKGLAMCKLCGPE